MRRNNVQSMPVDSLRFDSSIQPRVKINPAIVKEYATALSEGEQFPPVIVFNDGDNYWVADGFHRIMAAKEAGLTHIDAEVCVGTPRDAVLYAVGTNSAHGIRRSNADKRRAVEMLLSDEEWRQWSNIEIARRCVVSHTFVNSVREELSHNGTESPAKRKCADGRIIDTANIGKGNMSEPQYEQSDERRESDVHVGKGARETTDNLPEPLFRSVRHRDTTCVVAEFSSQPRQRINGAAPPPRFYSAFSMTQEEAIEYLQKGTIPDRPGVIMNDSDFLNVLLSFAELENRQEDVRVILTDGKSVTA